MKEEFGGEGAWEREFGFLKEFGLHSLYLTILTLARSKTEILNLAELVPDYGRLMRNDVIRLQQFWTKYFDSNEEKVKPRSQRELSAISWVLENQCPDKAKATRYYLYKLRTLPGWVRAELHEDKLIIASVQTAGKPVHQFRTKLLGIDMHVSVWTFHEVQEQGEPKVGIKVRMVFPCKYLTEPLAFGLSKFMPDFVEFQDVYVALCMSLSIDLTCDLVEGPSASTRESLIATGAFLGELSAQVRDHGIPISDIEPMLWEN